MTDLRRRSIFALIAGGGTGGHVSPALATADALVAGGHAKESLRFVGSKWGIEASLVPRAGYAITLLPTRGFARRLSFRHITATVGMVVGFARSLALMVRLRPSVVVSFGGYASVPCIVAAIVLRVPLVLHESNAVPGAANRLAAHFAKAIAVGLPDTRLARSTVTGNPVRPEIVALFNGEAASSNGEAARSNGEAHSSNAEVANSNSEARIDARVRLGLPLGRVVVAVFGGSQGARTINVAVRDLAKLWQGRADVAIYHLVGGRDWNGWTSPPEVGAGHCDAGLIYIASDYQSHMEWVYAAADVVVCRAGAMTVAEVATAGLPAVFVPYPYATADHQTANARSLERVRAAIVVPNGQCNGARLADVLEPLVVDADRRTAMRRAVRRLAYPDAAERLAALVDSVASA